MAVGDIDLGCGRAEIIITVPDELYYKIIGEMTGFDIKDEEELICLMRELAAVKRE